MGTEVLRIGVGAFVGIQLAPRVIKMVPSTYKSSAGFLVLAAAVLYLVYGKRPRGGLGDILDGVVIGIGASVAASMIKLPF